MKKVVGSTLEISALGPFHIYTETEPKIKMHKLTPIRAFTYTPKPEPNRKLKCLYTSESFRIYAETGSEPKPNAKPKTCTKWIFFFGFNGQISANTTGNFN